MRMGAGTSCQSLVVAMGVLAFSSKSPSMALIGFVEDDART